MKLKKRNLAILVLAVVFVALAAVYFAVIRPLVSVAEDDSVSLDLMDGESAITNKLTTFYIFDPISRDAISSIEVENEFGGYTLKRSTTDFYLDGLKGLPIDDNLLASLIVTAGTPIAMMRVAQGIENDTNALAEYGLDEPQASWTLTKTDGTTYTVDVGDELLTEGGYYVRYRGRDAVYIMSLTLADTILKPAEGLLTPILLDGLTESNYYLITGLTVYRDEEPLVSVARNANSESLILKLIYPRPENNTSSSFYELDEDWYFEVIYTFIDLSGTEVVATAPTDEVMEQYGLADPKYIVVIEAGSNEVDLAISDVQEDGYQYAMSSMYGFGTVVRVEPSTFAWLRADVFKWIETMPFYVYITSVSRLTVKGGEGSDVDLDFTLKHSTDDEGKAMLEVTENNSGKIFPNEDVSGFRNYYLTLMNITNQEYATLSEEDKALLVSDDSQLVMTMTYENTSGEVFEYKFYRYYENSTGHLSGGKLFVTVNGVGEFYTTNDLVEKALSDANRLMDGLDIDSYGHN